MKRSSTSENSNSLLSFSFSFIFIFSFIFLQQNAIAQIWMENANDASGKLNFYKAQANFNEYWKNRKPEKGQGYKQFKRWEYYWENRINKDGSFPSADIALGTWTKYLRDNKKSFDKRFQQANWESMGPSTTQGGYAGLGRINAICFHPTNSNIIWVGSPSGGLWKSTDNGASWTTNTDNFTILGVSGIVINPVNPDIMYIATGDGDGGDTPSIGVLKSTDGGATWNNTGLNWAASNGRKIRRILIDQNDVNTIMVASNIGIYVSNDAGSTWTNKLSGDFWDIRANPMASSNIFYACDDSKIYKSTDNGNNWVEKYDIDGFYSRIALAVSPADPNVLYALSWDAVTFPDGFYKGLFKSMDAGETFTTQSTTPNILDGTPGGTGYGNQGWYDLCLTVDPTDASIVYTGGIVTWKSTNSGVNWTLNNFWYDLGNGTPVVHADKHAYEWQNNTTLWSGNDGGVYKTSNGGTSWSSHSNGLVISQMYRLGVSQSDTKVITGLQDNGTKLRSIGGVWSDVLGGDGMECAINPVNSSVMYACIQEGELHRSTNGGLSFQDIQNNIPDQPKGRWVTPYALDPLNPTTIYAGYDQLWKSTDQGDNWTSIGSTANIGNFTKTIVEVAPSDPNIIITGRWNELYKTLNGGTSWSPIVCPGSDISMLEIHPTNPLIIWATNQSYSDGKVFKTIDGGASWTNISGTLPNLPANCIVYDKKSSKGGLYLGLDVGVYYRDNSMSDWILFSDNLPNVEVWELDINYNEQKLYAATYGRGLWKSDLYEVDFIVDGNKTICADFNWNYSVSNVSGATSYTWTLPSGWTGSSTTNNITVNPSLTSGTVQCVVGLPSGNRTYTLAVAVNSGCNTALDMDGTDDYIEVTSGAVNLSNTSFTVEFWAKRGAAGATDILVNQGSNGTNSRLHIGFRSSNQFTMDFYGNALNIPSSYSDDQWHHWSCVYDKSVSSPSHNRFIYRDGILVASDRSASDYLGTGTFQIGKYDGEYYAGSMDELRVWNVARSVSEIQSNIFCPMLSPPASLKLYLPFEDGLPGGDNLYDTETIDFSGNINHGNLNNFALSGSISNFVAGEKPKVMTGSSTVCPHLTWTYSINPVNGATSYTWTLPSGWTGTSSTNSITVSTSATNGNVQCVVAAPCGNLTFSLAVTVNPACNTGIDLDGSNDEIDLADGTYINGNFTVEAWVYAKSVVDWGRIMHFGENYGNNNAIMIFSSIGTNGRPALYINNGGTELAVNSSVNLPLNQWVHFAVTLNGTAGKMYFDGVEVGSATLQVPVSVTRSANYIRGNIKVDEFRIWNVVRTPAELITAMHCPMASSPSSVQMYLPFENGIPAGDNTGRTTVPDFSNYGRNGQFFNFALTGATSNFIESIKPKVMTGPETICNQFSWPFSVPAVAGATSYTWTLPSGWTGTSSTNSISVTPTSTGGNMQCIVAAPCGNLTFTKSVSVNAVCNTAMHFDGTNDYLHSPDFSFALDQPVTVEFWTKVNTADVKNSVLFSVGGTSSNDRFMAHVPWSDQNLYWDYGDSGGNGRLSLVFTPYLDKWVHVALVSAGNSGNFKGIYINGNLVASSTGASDGPNGTMTSIQLGGIGDHVKSKVDEFRIWNVMRTQAEIQANMFCPLISQPSSLKVYYPFENGNPDGTNTGTTTVLDFSGNNKHANIINMALTGSASNFTTGSDVTRYADSDGDGFGNPSVSTTSFCTSGTYVLKAGDCDDTNANINPYAVEVCGNSSDEDCDGNTDVEVNKALNFVGSGHNISIPAVAHSSAFTAEMWIKTSTTGFQNLIQWTGGSTTATFAISGDNLIGYYEGSGFHGGNNIADNVWHHVALVHNGYGSNNIKAYVDGILRLDATLTNVITNTGTVIGSGFNGNIDDVRFWNVALTQTQIQSRMNVRLDGNETNLIRYYPLDHGKPGMSNIYLTSAKDKTSNNQHGTLTGFTLTGATSNWITSWTYPTLYADADTDGYGGSVAWTCGTMTGYKTSSSDCNDNNAAINPYANEICGNSTDDDCDGNMDTEVNKGLHFAGSGGNRVTLPNLVHSEFFTVETWLKVPTNTTSRQIITWGGGPSGADLAIHTDNRIAYFEANSGNTGSVIADDQWHHIAMVHNGYGSSNVRIYVDGNLSVTMTKNSTIANTTLTLGSTNGGNSLLNGTLDDVRFWNVALTQSQIQSRMNLRLDGNETNLVRYYTFDHGKPSMSNAGLTIAKDKTSNNAHGTLTNFALTGSTSNWVNSWAYPTLYADNDADGFGGSGATWTCGTMTGFTTHNLDCVDSDNTRNPNATDICGNVTDENCNGLNDENTLSLHFDGSNDNVTFGNTLGNFGTGDFTIESRIKSTNVSDYILSKRPGCGCFNFWNIDINGTGKIRIEMMENVSCGNYGEVISATSVNDGNWHHFAIVRKNGAIRIYIDGALDAVGTITTNVSNTAELSVGSNPCGNPFGGEIDEMRIWNTARTGAEVNAFKNAVVPGSAAGLLAYYDFNHATAVGGGTNTGLNSLVDRTSGGFNGTLNNFALTGSTSNWKGNPGTTLTWYADADGDTYGNRNDSIFSCVKPSGYVANKRDCNDSNGSINPGATEIIGNGIDDDCDGKTDEVASVKWVALNNNANNNTCTSSTNCCTQTFCFGLEYTPATTGTLASYTTGFLTNCNISSSPIISNVSCVMDDNSFGTVSCMGPNGVLMNSSGFNGALSITSGVPIIIHQLCLNLPDNSSKTIIEDFITDISMSIDLPESGAIDEFPTYSPFTVEGNKAPVITQGTIATCFASVSAAEAAALSATMATDDCPGTVTFSASTIGTCAAIITVTATDACGLTNSVDYTTRIDNTGPVITAGCNMATQNLACDATLPVAKILANFTVSDACAGGVTLHSIVTNPTNGIPTNKCSATAADRTVTRTYTFRDACNNETTCVETFVFAPDVTGPVISAGCTTAAQDLACNASLPTAKVLADFTVTDACVGGVTLFSVVTNPASGVPTNKCSATAADRTVTRTYTFRDACNNETTCVETFVFAQDITGPVISAGCTTAAQDLACNASLPTAKVLADFTVTDACIGGVTLFSVVTNPASGVPTNKCSATAADRTVTRTYTFRDVCYNETTCVETFVFAQDITGPTVSAGCTTTSQNLACDASLPTAKVIGDFTITDDCVGMVTLHSVVTNPTNGTPTNRCSAIAADRTVTRTYTFRDACNNETTCVETFVFAQDVTGPVISAGCTTAAQDIACNANLPTAKVLADFTVTDACAGGVTLHSIVTNPVSGVPTNKCSATAADRTVTRTYTFRDACNNETTCVETIVFAQDITEPTVSAGCTTAAQDLACNANLPAAKVLADFTVTDACAGGVTLHSIVTNPVSGVPTNKCSATAADRTVTRTYTFRDACNNEITCVETFIFAQDITEPTVSAGCTTASQDLACNANLPTAKVLADFTVTDACVGGVTLFSVVTNPTNGIPTNKCSATAADRTVTRTYTFRDACNNETTCVETFVFTQDVTGPVISAGCTTAAQDLACNASLPTAKVLADFTVTDACIGGVTLFSVVTNPASGVPTNKCSATAADRTVTRTYTFRDVCYNETTCVETFVFAQDITGPTVSAGCTTTSQNLACDASLPTAKVIGDFTITDDCVGMVTLHSVVTNPTNGTPTNRCSAIAADRTVTRTYTFRDACNNETTCVETFVFAQDVTGPVISAGCTTAAQDLACNANLPTAKVLADFTVTDACVGGVTLFSVVTNPVSGVPTNKCSATAADRTVTRTYTLRDACNNETTCVETFVFAQDVTGPVISAGCTTTSQDLACNASLPAAKVLADFTVTDACVGGVTLFSVVTNPVSGVPTNKCSATVADRTVTRTYTFRDACNNETTCVETFVFAQDITGPVISAGCTTTSQNLACDASLPTAKVIGDFTITDDCVGMVTLHSVVTNPTNGTPTNRCSAIAADRTVTRTYTFRDACNNETTCVETFVFAQDVTGPVISAGCTTTSQDLACNASLPAAKVLADFTVTDACVGGVTLFSVVTNPVSGVPTNKCSATAADRTVTRTYTFRDACNNETTCVETFLFAQDVTGPVISAGCTTAAQDLACNASLPTAKVLADFTVTDACIGGVTLFSVVTNPVSGVPTNKCSDTAADRTVTRTYTFRDACNNETTCVETFVFAQDITGPVISAGCTTTSQDLACNASLPAAKVLADFTVTDACAGGVTLHSIVTNPVSGVPTNKCSATAADRTVTRTYTFRDACNNETTCVETFIFAQDITEPTVSAGCTTAAQDLACNANLPTAKVLADFTVTDACVGGVTLFSVVTNPTNGVPTNKCSATAADRTVTRTYTFRDACNNETTCVETFLFAQDVTGPVISAGCTTAAQDLACNASLPTAKVLADFTVTDACVGGVTLFSVVTNPTNGIPTNKCSATAADRTVTRTYTFRDACNNETTCVETFLFAQDVTGPVIIGSITSTIVEGCNVSVAPAAVSTVSALEGLPGNPSISDGCTADEGLVVTHSDVVSGTCHIVITRTYTIKDACLNMSMIVHTINVVIPNNIVEVGGPVVNSANIESSLYAVTPLNLPVFHNGCGQTLIPSGPVLGGTYVEGGCTGTITYTYTYTNCAGNIVLWVFTYNVDCKKINIKVNMQGSYSVTGDSTRTDLNRFHLLPGQDKTLSGTPSITIGAPYTPFGQPYSALPWNYTGNNGMIYGDPSSPGAPVGVIPYPKHVSDWVLVTIRENSILPAGNIFRCVGWVHKNGEITFPETCPNELTINTSSSYYILVEHRNHLAVMDTAAVLNSGGYLNLDFSLNNSYAPIFRHGQNLLEPGVWGMIEGNVDQVTSRASINSGDRTGWKNDQNKLGYNKGDIDLNSATNSLDETKWKLSQNKTTGIIFN